MLELQTGDRQDQDLIQTQNWNREGRGFAHFTIRAPAPHTLFGDWGDDKSTINILFKARCLWVSLMTRASLACQVGIFLAAEKIPHSRESCCSRALKCESRVPLVPLDS